MRSVCNTRCQTPPELNKMERPFKTVRWPRNSPLVSLVVDVGGHILTPVSRANLFIPCCFMPTFGTAARASLPRCHQGQASRRRQAWRRCRWSPHCQAIRHQRSECQASTGLGDDGLNVILAVLDQGFLPGMNIAKVCEEFAR